MKQHCTFLDCDYFDGGDCLELCMQPKHRTIHIQPAEPDAPRQALPPLEIDVAEPDHDPQDFDASTTFIAGLIVVVLFLTLITLIHFA